MTKYPNPMTDAFISIVQTHLLCVLLAFVLRQLGLSRCIHTAASQCGSQGLVGLVTIRPSRDLTGA